MSTLKVNKIENTATADGGIAIDSAGHVQLDGLQLPTTGQLSNRNIVINGAMTVSQRSTSETGQTSLDAYVTVDRFRTQLNSSGTFTISQSTEAPDGFANSLKFDCTTADASPNYLVVFQDLEGQDLQHIQKGKSTAQKLTASFYVRSSKTGTYQVNLRDLDNTRLVGASYSISSANTWEYKTVTFAADTTGQLGNDNGGSLRIEWWLAAGSGYSGGTMPTAWEALANTDRAAALNVDIGTATSDDFYITGVQLELGDKATPFEHRSYCDELAKCQRYYQQSYAGASATGSNDGAITASCVGNVNRAFGNVFWANTMRAAPTVTWYSGSTGTSAKWRNHSDGADITAAGPVLAIGISGYGFVLSAGISAITDTLFAHYDADAEL